jgi:hypothetical protein
MDLNGDGFLTVEEVLRYNKALAKKDTVGGSDNGPFTGLPGGGMGFPPGAFPGPGGPRTGFWPNNNLPGGMPGGNFPGGNIRPGRGGNGADNPGGGRGRGGNGGDNAPAADNGSGRKNRGQ